MQNEQEFTKQTRQGRVLLKGNSMCKDTSVYGLTPFTGDPYSIGSSSKCKALLNKQAKCTPNHNSFTDMGMLSPENLSTGCKYTVRFLESRRFLIQGTTRNLALWWREWLQCFVLSPGGIHSEMKPPFYLVNHFQIYSLLNQREVILIKLLKPFIKFLLTQGVMSS